MSFLHNLQLKLHQYFLQKKLKKNQVERYSLPFTKAKRIGILYNATNPENEAIVSAYRKRLQNEGKKVEMLAFINDKENHDQQLFKYFNRKNLSWILEPKGSVVEQFMDTPFDVLLCLHIEPLTPLECVAALSKAHLRVGQYRSSNTYDSYDLSIDTPKGDNLKNFIGQVDYYIKNLNKEKK